MTSIPLDIEIDIPDYQIIPDPTGEDGKVLTVVSGAYALETPSGGGGTTLPDPTGENGKILGVVSNDYALVAAPEELPAVTGSDNGKVLTVVGGVWAAATPSGDGGGGIVQGSSVSLSGADEDISISSGCERFSILVNGASVNDANSMYLRASDSGGFLTSGYISSGDRIANAAVAAAASTGGLVILTAASALSVYGVINFHKFANTHTWLVSGKLHTTDFSGLIFDVGGQFTLSSEITAIRILSTTGTFDNGTFSKQEN